MQTRVILWAALFGSTFMYLFVWFMIPHPAPAPLEPIMPIALGATALSVIGVAFFLPARLLAQAVGSLSIRTVEAERFGDVPAGTRYFENPEAARRAAAPALQTAFILRMALFESVAIFGLVLGFLGHPPFAFGGFFVVAWALMALEFPTQAADDRALTKASGALFR